MKKDFYPEEIAEVLCDGSNVNPQDCVRAIEYIMAAAQNKYNDTSYSALWDAFQAMCENAR